MGTFLPQCRIHTPRPCSRRRKPKKQKTIQHGTNTIINNWPWTHRCVKLPIGYCHFSCKNKSNGPCKKSDQDQEATECFQHATEPYRGKINSCAVIRRHTHWVSK